MYSTKDIQDWPESVAGFSTRQRWRDQAVYTEWYAGYHIFWPSVKVYSRGADSWTALQKHPAMMHVLHNWHDTDSAVYTAVMPLSHPSHITVCCAPDPVSVLSGLMHRCAALICSEKDDAGEDSTAGFLYRFCLLSAGMIIQACGTDPVDLQRWLKGIMHNTELNGMPAPAGSASAENNEYDIRIRTTVSRRIAGYVSALFGLGKDNASGFLSGCRGRCMYRLSLMFFISGIMNRWLYNTYFNLHRAPGYILGQGADISRVMLGAYLGYFNLYAIKGRNNNRDSVIYTDFMCSTPVYGIMDILTWLLERELVSAGICQDACSGSLLPPDRYNVSDSLR